MLIRDVPEEDLAHLRAEAAARGTSLQAYMLELVHEKAAAARNRATMRRAAERLHDAPPIDDDAVVDAIAAVRDERGRGLRSGTR